MGEDKEKLAEDRTDLAEDRTLLANERTFAGWMRTGFASIGVGLGFNALFGMIEPAWLPKAIATAFLLIGVFVFVVADRRACVVHGRLHAHDVQPFNTSNLRWITIGVSIATCALIAAIWMVKQ